MFKKCKNSRSQGDIGLGACIAYLASQNWTVLLPLTDSQGYDVCFDDGRSIKKVQVKTTSYKIRKWWNFNLSTKGGNRSYNTVKKFDNKSVDFVFVLTSDGTKYFILSSKITSTGTMSLIPKWNQYII